MEPGRVHLVFFIMVLPVIIVFSAPYVVFWGFTALYQGLVFFLLYFLPLVIAGIFVHELLHATGWSFFTTRGIRSVKFGFSWKFLAPYCHCREPLRSPHYAIGTGLPLIVLGVLPGIIGIVLGQGSLVIFGIVFTWTAVGDIITLYMLRNIGRDVMVYDHPDKMGFFIRQGS